MIFKKQIIAIVTIIFKKTNNKSMHELGEELEDLSIHGELTDKDLNEPYDEPGDNGGLTYAGISQKSFPKWCGWKYIKPNGDNEDITLTFMVKEFYNKEFWTHVNLDSINSQCISETIFDFAVNAGAATAVKLAQVIIDERPDGIIGLKTLNKLNQLEEERDVIFFILKYMIAKITRYAAICNRDKSQNKFFLGWINRALKGA